MDYLIKARGILSRLSLVDRLMLSPEGYTTEEHKKALDWLNDHTTDEIAFYGVKIELIQIDNSNPAIQFNVKSSPNEVVRQATKRKEQGELSEAKKLQLDFWTEFKEKLRETGKIGSLQTPRPQYWFDVALGKSGINLSNTFNTWENIIGVRVYISNKVADEWLPYFENHKEEIETKIGSKLEWNPNPDNKDKVIVLTKPYELDNRENWNEPIDWLVNQTVIFREIFAKLIREKGKEKEIKSI